MASASTIAPDSTFRVVCLCGSAGALHAYIEILRQIPCDTGMAFVIAAHRGFQDADLLREALSSVTRMQVFNVEQGATIRPNRVHILPPGIQLRLRRDSFEIAPAPDRRGWPVCISSFLHSAAAELGSRLVAVILSGHGFDGSSEMQRIKDRGGVTFAQADAHQPEMPSAAENSGCVDAVLSVRDLTARLLELASAPLASVDGNGKADGSDGVLPAMSGPLFEYVPPTVWDRLAAADRRVACAQVSMASTRQSIHASYLAIERTKALLEASSGVVPLSGRIEDGNRNRTS